MVRPTFEYSLPVWDPKPPPLRQNLERNQRKAARFVHSAYIYRTPGCVTKIVQNLGCESLEHRRYISWLLMIFKIHHQIVVVSGATGVLQLNDTRTRCSPRFKQTTCATTSYVIVIPWVVRLYVEIIHELYVQVDKHGITILYHLHQCRPCTSSDILC